MKASVGIYILTKEIRSVGFVCVGTWNSVYFLLKGASLLLQRRFRACAECARSCTLLLQWRKLVKEKIAAVFSFNNTPLHDHRYQCFFLGGGRGQFCDVNKMAIKSLGRFGQNLKVSIFRLPAWIIDRNLAIFLKYGWNSGYWESQKTLHFSTPIFFSLFGYI